MPAQDFFGGEDFDLGEASAAESAFAADFYNALAAFSDAPGPEKGKHLRAALTLCQNHNLSFIEGIQLVLTDAAGKEAAEMKQRIENLEAENDQLKNSGPSSGFPDFSDDHAAPIASDGKQRRAAPPVFFLLLAFGMLTLALFNIVDDGMGQGGIRAAQIASILLGVELAAFARCMTLWAIRSKQKSGASNVVIKLLFLVVGLAVIWAVFAPSFHVFASHKFGNDYLFITAQPERQSLPLAFGCFAALWLLIGSNLSGSLKHVIRNGASITGSRLGRLFSSGHA